MWRVLYPIGIHYVTMQIVSMFFMAVLYLLGKDGESPYTYVLWCNMLGGIAAIPIAYVFFKRDQRMRGAFASLGLHNRKWGEGLLVFFMGAALAQYLNLILAVLQMFQIFPEYSDSMERILENHGFMLMFLWTGIVAPICEELIFRWLIYRRLRDWMGIWGAALISSVLFGLYHGNVLQFIYATILGILMALSIEYTGNLYASIFMHMGANIWASVMSWYGAKLLEIAGGRLYMWIMYAFMLIIVGGMIYFIRGKNRQSRNYGGTSGSTFH